MAQRLTIELTDAATPGVCACCGHTNHRVGGLVWRDEEPHAAYFVDWTQGHVAEKGSLWSIVLGEWGDGTSAADRVAVNLHSRHDDKPGFGVIDADPASAVMSNLAGTALRRDEVIGKPIAADIFAICDAVLDQDDRVKAMWDAS